MVAILSWMSWNSPILLTSPTPPGGFFHRGSVLYLPKRDKPTDPLPQVLLKEKVRIHLATRKLPLNRDPDTGCSATSADG
jgi:hypothetical protein